MEEPTSGQEPEAVTGGGTAWHAGPEHAGPRDAGPGDAAGSGEPAGAVESAGSAPAEPAGPEPLGVGVTPTGDAAVDTRLRRLADADHLPVSGHLEVYEDVHRGLRDALAALDQRPGPPTPSTTFSTPHDNRS
ncbi:hypothetical protein ACWC2K_26860 [Streptomyces chattanoogensis]